MLHILAALVALSDPTGSAIEVGIADVIADPERYGGKILRIRGQVDACYSHTCWICPEEMTSETLDGDKCLRIAFDGFMSEADRVGPTDAPYTAVAWRQVEEIFRFSVLTAEGEFDPSCLTGRPWPPEPPETPDDKQIETIVCTDRATTWRGLQVRAVHRRIPSNEGLVAGRGRGALSPAPEGVSTAVNAAYLAYLAELGADWDEPTAVFLPELQTFKPGVEEARLCVCLKESCETDWPLRDISTWARTPNDPYVCHVALKIDGAWRVYPE